MTTKDFLNHQPCEQAAFYALGILDGEELLAYERHLREGCSFCQKELSEFTAVVHQLRWNITPILPPPGLRQKILEAIQQIDQTKERTQKAEPRGDKHPIGLTFVLASDDKWEEVSPGILLKSLYMDTQSERMTALVRMTPGANYGAHRHTAPEEFYVLEGSCFCGGQVLRVGDYHRAEVGSVHHETSSQEGCLMLIIFSPNNEILTAQPRSVL